ncbi:MFS transporter [Alkalibaculum sporogenes]|uniref:MFS transporter n=1 Tax=Alkalibaculum sporogenes TaxID=2655001 RepID=UPI00128D19C9
MKKGLNKTLTNWFGIGDFFFDICNSYKTYFWVIFLTSVAKLPLATIALISAVVSTTEIFLSPFYGVALDVLKPMRWGRYRSYLMILPPITAILFASQWFAAGISNVSIASVSVIVLSLMFALSFNMQNTANMSLIPLVAATESERAHLSSRRWAWMNLAKVVIGSLVAALIALYSGIFGNESVMTYAVIACTVAALTIIGMQIHFRMTKGYEGEGSEVYSSSKVSKAQRISMSILIRTLTKNPPLIAIFIASTFTAITSFTLAMMAAHYFNYVAEAPAMLAIYLTVTNLGAVCGSLLAGVFSKKMDIKRLSMIALIFMVVGLGSARLFAFSALGFTISIIFVQFFASFNYPLFITMYSNCAVYGEWKTGVKAAGVVMGISNVPVKIAVMVAGILIPGILGAAGFVADGAITQTVKAGIANGITLVPMASYMCAFLTITFGFKLTREKLNEYQSEIDARNVISE